MIPISIGTSLSRKSNDSPSSTDWIAVYAAGTNTYYTWRYTNGAASGSVEVDLPGTLLAPSDTWVAAFPQRFLQRRPISWLFLRPYPDAVE